jgi:hypothetical protein
MEAFTITLPCCQLAIYGCNKVNYEHPVHNISYKRGSTNDVYEIVDHVLWDVLCDVQVIEDIRIMKAINKEWDTTCVQKLDVEVQGTHTPCQSS